MARLFVVAYAGVHHTRACCALPLRCSLKDWKQLELFEREAQTLKSLSHPCIPRYLDYFEADTEQDRAFFLVQVSNAPCFLPGPGQHWCVLW